MNGAESLVRTMVGAGVDVSFTNPGTSEMHFVAALDRVDGMRCVLCLFEGGATGAADGYARMADKPAATLLHLGPGMANGLANIHNARRARSPMINIVGEHALYHRRFDAPLTTDIEALAHPLSHWVRTGSSSMTVAQDGADAIHAASNPPGQIATLILPADTAWGEGSGPVATRPPRARGKVADDVVREIAKIAMTKSNVMLMVGGVALREKPLKDAARIAKKTGGRLMAPGANARVQRGAGRIGVDRVPYVIDLAVAALADVRCMILVGAKPPVGFFGYPGKPSAMTHPDCEFHVLADEDQDLADALARLADEIGAAKLEPDYPHEIARPEIPTAAKLDPDSIGAVLGALMPENAIVCDESVTTGRNFFAMTKAAAPHDWLQLMGGAIGEGIPLATGASVACPDRKVINLQADGSGMYTLQALWTQAREKCDVLTLIWANRSYAILKGELLNVGAKNPGRKAHDMLSLDNPPLDWVSLAKGMGVEASRAETVDELVKAMRGALSRKGPYLIEVVI
ncbi:acetolactate synthase large subunit [Terrarubrum flagellatum]|uniref:acetolactate synthase large subunit n=1 Tax=Terrirubrum flagellatum TaxID=2895980 RepID=UPI00314567E6